MVEKNTRKLDGSGLGVRANAGRGGCDINTILSKRDAPALPHDTLVAPAVVYGYAVAHPYIAAGAVATVGFIVSAAIKLKEKLMRGYHDLPDQPQLSIEPFIDPETKKSKLKFTISGSYPDRRILLKMGKGLYYGLFDTVIGDRISDGEIIIDSELLLDIAKAKKIIDVGLPQITDGTKSIWLYAQEVRPWMGDIRSPITRVDVEVKGIIETAKEELDAISPEEAATRAAAGLLSYVKFWIPVLSILPGVPYTPGMWIPFGFIITKKP